MAVAANLIFALASLAFMLGFQGAQSVSWEEWWTYDGISGPSFWGLINPDWRLCNSGRLQSPIDVDPRALLFDPALQDLTVTDVKTEAVLSNSGHAVVIDFDADDTETARAAAASAAQDVGANVGSEEGQEEPISMRRQVNISGGPVSYNYPVHRLVLHFGLEDAAGGSEHSVGGRSFAAEVQIVGFNADLYENASAAARGPNGMVAVAVLVELGELSNRALRRVTEKLPSIQYGGSSVLLRDLSVADFLPEGGGGGFVTYRGSLTEPGCSETVDWVVLNRPITITHKQLSDLRKLMQGDSADPRAPLGGNFRPVQPVNAREVRTNIRLRPDREQKCPTLHENLHFQASPRPDFSRFDSA